MKKTLLFLLLIAFAITASAQDKHMKFMGIPINGTIRDVVTQLETKGFTVTKLTNSDAYLKGEFAGEKDCAILIQATQGIVYNISVFLPERLTWTGLKYDYVTFRDAITEKYGSPSRKTERFYSPFYEGDGYEMTAVRNNKCKYLTLFELPQGEIVVCISKDHSVIIYYADKINKDRESADNKLKIQADI